MKHHKGVAVVWPVPPDDDNNIINVNNNMVAICPCPFLLILAQSSDWLR